MDIELDTPIETAEGGVAESRAKKPAKKPPGKKAAASADKPKVPQDRAELILADINKQMKGVGRVDTGPDISYLDPPRIRTGILGLDIVSNGGLPRGGIVKFWGPYSSAKTTSLIKVMVAEQRRGKRTAFAVGEGFSKTWARQNGLWIPYSTKEYEGKTADERRSMEAYDRWGEETGCGQVSLIQHKHGDGLLEATAKVVKANIFSVVGVDSLAVLKNQRQLEEMEIGDEERGGGGQIQMFNRFAARIFNAMNTRYNEAFEEDINGEVMNDTCLVCLDQARIKVVRGPSGASAVHYQEVGGEGLKHFWQLNIQFRRGEEIGEKENFDGHEKWVHWAAEINIKGIKSKIGPEGRNANWHLYIQDHEPFTGGDIDHAREVRQWGVQYGIIEQKGAFYSFNGERLAQGKENVDIVLRENESVCQAIEDLVVERCRA